MFDGQLDELLIQKLDGIIAAVHAQIKGRQPFQKTVMIGANTPYVLDYRDRKYVFLFSPVALTLSLEDLGVLLVPANTWVNISFTPGVYLFAPGQSSNVAVFVKQTDDLLNDGYSMITADQIRAYTMGGQAFSAATGKNQAAAAATLGFQLFNPANSGKSLLIYSLILNIASATFHDMRMTTADVSSIAGWTNTPIAPVNNRGGGPVSVATAGYSNVALTGGLLGTTRETIGVAANQSMEALTNGECIFLPASNSLNGVAIYINATGTNNWSVTCEYLEF